MLGWMILFAIFALLSLLRMIAGHPPDASARLAALLFAVLFVVAALTRAARGRAW